jgi:hypothetical protein
MLCRAVHGARRTRCAPYDHHPSDYGGQSCPRSAVLARHAVQTMPYATLIAGCFTGTVMAHVAQTSHQSSARTSFVSPSSPRSARWHSFPATRFGQ